MTHRYPNTGKPPRDKTAVLGIEWACGLVSQWTYTAEQLRWSVTGHPFDVGHYWRAA